MSVKNDPVKFDGALRHCDRESGLDVFHDLFDSQHAAAFRIDPNAPRIARGDGAPAVYVGDLVAGKLLLHPEVVDYRLMSVKSLAPDLCKFGLGFGGKHRSQHGTELAGGSRAFQLIV